MECGTVPSGMHDNQVAKLRRRYIGGGLGALQDEPRSGRKGSIGTEVLRQIFDQATRPPHGRARWTSRAMGVSHRGAGLASRLKLGAIQVPELESPEAAVELSGKFE